MSIRTRYETQLPLTSIELVDGEVTYLELPADLLRETRHDAAAFAGRVLPFLRHALRLHGDELMQELTGEPEGGDERLVLGFLKEALPRLSEAELDAPPSPGETMTVEGDLLTLELIDGLPVTLLLDDYAVRPEARLELEQALRAALNEALTQDAEALDETLRGTALTAETLDWASLADRIFNHQKREYR